jgi:hypothetical protein
MAGQKHNFSNKGDPAPGRYSNRVAYLKREKLKLDCTWMVLQSGLAICRLDLISGRVFGYSQDIVGFDGRRLFIEESFVLGSHLESGNWREL